MACVTLKRPLDFDPLEVLHSPNRPPTKRRRCTPIKNVDRLQTSSRRKNLAKATKTSTTTEIESVFREMPFTKDEISNKLKGELKLLKRRRQAASVRIAEESQVEVTESSLLKPFDLQNLSKANDEIFSQQSKYHPENGMPPKPSAMKPFSFLNGSNKFVSKSSELCNPLMAEKVDLDKTPSMQLNSIFSQASKKQINSEKEQNEKKVFTLNEMTLLCEKMCKERTDAVRQEYDKILHTKLSEQYDAFVKFIDHQIQQRFNESQLPSYLS